MWTIGGVTYEWEPGWFDAWAGWAQAMATAVALWLALKQGRDASGRERQARRAATFAALHTAEGLVRLLNESTDKGENDPHLTAQQATALLRSGAFREVLSGVADIRIADLAGPGAARAWVSVRVAVRDTEQALSVLADVPTSAGYVQLTPIRKGVLAPLRTLRQLETRLRPKAGVLASLRERLASSGSQ